MGHWTYKGKYQNKVRESRVGNEILNRLFRKGKMITFKQISRTKKIKTEIK